MCTDNDGVGIVAPSEEREGGLIGEERHSIESCATYLCSVRGGWKRAQVGFIGYSGISKGDKVLIAATGLHERQLLCAISNALKRAGANSVDLMLLDWGPDREFDYEDEVKFVIRQEHWSQNPRWYDYQERVINYAKENGYDFLIHGRGGPIPETDFKFEAIPWTTVRMLQDRSTFFPPKLNELINIKTWNMIYKEGRGGKVRLTDPEGTDLEFTLLDRYYEGARRGFTPAPQLGHLHSHPTPPIIAEDDTRGIVAGTTSHLSKPFPAIKVHLESDRVEQIEGGGRYGDAWRRLLELTSKVKYPEFPAEGLFWLWEAAIGTNPKVRRQPDVMMLHSGGFEWERNRSGVIHMGFGTRWRGESERWAAERGITYGHLHIHLLYPTYEIRLREGGRTVRVIEDGHLTALDDPEVRAEAEKYGDPEELLKEDWKAPIPGISVAGKYADYAVDPYSWIKERGLPSC